jgi:formylmethanofuran dehydrogenase subunit E
MNTLTFTPIGHVVNTFNDIATSIHEVRSLPSRLIIYPAYTQALLRIELCEYIDVVYYLHLLQGAPIALSRTNREGVDYGLFATRLPERPNRIGVSTVRLLEAHPAELIVTGLDALNGSPLLDIKRSASRIEN